MGEVLANTPQAFVNYTEALALPSDVDFFSRHYRSYFGLFARKGENVPKKSFVRQSVLTKFMQNKRVRSVRPILTTNVMQNSCL